MPVEKLLETWRDFVQGAKKAYTCLIPLFHRFIPFYTLANGLAHPSSRAEAKTLRIAALLLPRASAPETVVIPRGPRPAKPPSRGLQTATTVFNTYFSRSYRQRSQLRSSEKPIPLATFSTATTPTNSMETTHHDRSPSTPSRKTAQIVVNEATSIKPIEHEWRFYACFGCLCLVNFVCAIDATVLSVSLPMIAEKLGGTAIEAFWAGTSFLLTSTVFQPTWASLSHIFGRRPLILTALFIFTTGTIICGLANNFTVLLVGRSIQGCGGGGIIALTYVIATDLVTLRERGKWFGLISSTWALGSVIGPVIGGVFAEKVTWRWIFWVNLPFCGLGFVLIPIFLRLNHIPGSFLSKAQRVDWLGSVIFIGSTTSFLIPLTWGGVMYPWSSARTLVPLVLGVVGLLVFILYSASIPKHPLIPGAIFRNRTSIITFIGTTIHGCILWSLLYYLPLYYETAKALSPILTGVALFPQTFTVAPVCIATGLLITKYGRYTPYLYAGWICTILGVGLLVHLRPSTPTLAWVGLNVVSGLGLGLLYPAMSFAVQAAAADVDLPFAAAMFSFFRAFGQALGVAVGGVVFQNQFKRNLTQYPALAGRAREYSSDASALVKVILGMPEGKGKTELVEAYVGGLRTVWIVMCALAAFAGVIAVVGTKAIGLDRVLDTRQGYVGDKKGMIRMRDVEAGGVVEGGGETGTEGDAGGRAGGGAGAGAGQATDGAGDSAEK